MFIEALANPSNAIVQTINKVWLAFRQGHDNYNSRTTTPLLEPSPGLSQNNGAMSALNQSRLLLVGCGEAGGIFSK